MEIKFTLLQNFTLAIIIISLFVVLFFLMKHAFKKKTIIQVTVPQPVTMHDVNTNITPHHQDNKDDQDYRFVLRAAQKHAKNLLYHSSIAASDLIVGVKKTNEHMETQLDKVLHDIAAQDIHTLKETTKNFDNKYQDSLQEVQTEMQKTSSEMLVNIQKQYNEKLDSFLKELLKNGQSTQGVVDNKTAELVSAAEAEIAEYKNAKLARIDEEVGKLVQTVYSDVLRISIPENVHQELIVKSLEEAKKDGMFKL